jgi:hypothetical protein
VADRVAHIIGYPFGLHILLKSPRETKKINPQSLGHYTLCLRKLTPRTLLFSVNEAQSIAL